ncbi:MAG TPA: MOSC domain-containing protein [Candidatus Baltobacteraceae bacterium]|nr:MOSC domain-containing protein [Candidatus Baltobacteraceae bacterium]
MIVGTLTSIWRYPTKSLRGEPLETAQVEDDGVRGDRTSAFFVTTPGRARTGKPYRGKENDGLHLVRETNDAVALAGQHSLQIEGRSGQRYFDDAPISILLDRWLDDLSALVGYAVEPLRFRPNFFVTAAPEFAGDEIALQGCVLDLGAVRLRVVKPIERCVVPTYHPTGGASDPRILRLLAAHRDTKMGIYCHVITPGTVHVGDSLGKA